MIDAGALPTLFPQISGIPDPALRTNVERAWGWLAARSAWDRFEDIPTHTSSTVTNLAHSRHVLDATVAFADSLEAVHGIELDRGVLVAAGILMDASKMLEYERAPGGGCRRTETYGALPHATMGAVAAIEAGLPATVVDIILTHSPRSQRQPASIEGRILRMIDEADAIAIGVL